MSYFDETGKIPEEIANALSSIYALEAIGTSKESLLNAMLVQADTDKEVKAVLSAMEALGIETALSYNWGSHPPYGQHRARTVFPG